MKTRTIKVLPSFKGISPSATVRLFFLFFQTSVRTCLHGASWQMAPFLFKLKWPLYWGTGKAINGLIKILVIVEILVFVQAFPCPPLGITCFSLEVPCKRSFEDPLCFNASSLSSSTITTLWCVIQYYLLGFYDLVPQSALLSNKFSEMRNMIRIMWLHYLKLIHTSVLLQLFKSQGNWQWLGSISSKGRVGNKDGLNKQIILIMTEAPVEMYIRVYWIPLWKPQETFAQVLTFLPGLSKGSITNKIKNLKANSPYHKNRDGNALHSLTQSKWWGFSCEFN